MKTDKFHLHKNRRRSGDDAAGAHILLLKAPQVLVTRLMWPSIVMERPEVAVMLC